MRFGSEFISTKALRCVLPFASGTSFMMYGAGNDFKNFVSITSDYSRKKPDEFVIFFYTHQGTIFSPEQAEELIKVKGPMIHPILLPMQATVGILPRLMRPMIGILVALLRRAGVNEENDLKKEDDSKDIVTEDMVENKKMIHKFYDYLVNIE